MKKKLKTIDLNEKLKDDIVDLYVRVFAGPPWYEVLKCKSCGVDYGSPDDNLAEIARKGICTKNEECGKPLQLMPFYTGEDNLAQKIYLNALEQKGFVGVAGIVNEQPIGFSWGFALQDEDSPSVKFSKVKAKFIDADIEPSEVFYAAETGVDPRYRKQGIGTSLAGTRICRANLEGFKKVAFRTKNDALIRVFERLFGEGHVLPLFNDPDPVKKDDLWYVCEMKNLASDYYNR